MTLRKQVIAPVLALVAIAGVSRAATNCCGPVFQQPPRNIAWQLVADADVPLSVYIPIAEDAAQKWNTELANRGMNGSLTQGSGDLKIVFSKDSFYPTMLYHPDQNMIVLPKELTTDPKFTGDFILGVFLHEFGHPLGWGQAQCVGTSVMSDTTLESFKTAFTDCDRSTFNANWKPRRDDDGDGYSQEEGDCDDYDAAKNPGVILHCSGLTNSDMNCNGQQDDMEMESTCNLSPLLVDVEGNGFRMTSAEHGVFFDLNPDGVLEKLSWTIPGGDDAWLALDRNGNGAVDNGTELFGNFTPQPATAMRHGFAALAVFDQNGDKWIDINDPVFLRLTLWTDSNHDGISQAKELRSLAQAKIVAISLDVKRSSRRDRFGNDYRYRARILTEDPSGVGPHVYDVFLKVR